VCVCVCVCVCETGDMIYVHGDIPGNESKVWQYDCKHSEKPWKALNVRSLSAKLPLAITLLVRPAAAAIKIELEFIASRII